MNDELKDKLDKAKKFFSRKLKNKYQINKDFDDHKFRDLDNQELKISKIKARIDHLRKKEQQIDKNNLYAPQKRINVKETKKKKDDLEKNSVIKNVKSIKNFDSQNIPVHNFLLKFNDKETLKVTILSNFEINSNIMVAGEINDIPKVLVVNLLKLGLIRLLNKYEIQQFKNNSYKVKKTINLTEIKRSKLINKKNIGENN